MSTTVLRSRSDGFTLIEVLFVLAIVSLLVTLSVPAIQSSREASRRAQCLNNLHQYGLALASFESLNARFPSSFTLTIKGKALEESEWAMCTYMVGLLPFLDQGALSSQYDTDQMFCAKANLPVVQASLPFAICPSSPSRDSQVDCTFIPSLMFSNSVRENSLAKPLLKYVDKKYSTSYQGSISDYTIAFSAQKGFVERYGYKAPKDSLYGLESMFPFPVDTAKNLAARVLPLYDGPVSAEFSRSLRAAEVTDGLSNTFTMIEIAGRPEHWTKAGRNVADDPLDRPWADPRSLQELKPTGADAALVQVDNRESLFSFHPNAVNVLYADGHAQAIDAQVDTRTLLGWMTPNQSDPLPMK
jgi:prepilin-type N-terminal cleavage/methylation domain-containing protein/prepilin-type processing-associated H-X9-DG protein